MLTGAVGRCLTSAKGGNREPDPYGSRNMSGYGDLVNRDVDYCGYKAIAAGNVFIIGVGTETNACFFGVVCPQEPTTTPVFVGTGKCFPYRCTPISFRRSAWVALAVTVFMRPPTAKAAPGFAFPLQKH